MSVLLFSFSVEWFRVVLSPIPPPLLGRQKRYAPSISLMVFLIFNPSPDGVQFFLLPLVLGAGLLPLALSNLLYAGALSWYWYITHLGYRSLPFLSNTEVFLFPIAAVCLFLLITLVGYPLGLGYNAARVMARFYFM